MQFGEGLGWGPVAGDVVGLRRADNCTMTSPDATAKSSALFQIAANALNELRAVVPDHDRITDDEQGVLSALAFSLRADCTRRRVACVVVDAFGYTIGSGRNGAPPGRPGCLSAGACPRGQMTYAQVKPGSSYAPGQTGTCVANHAEVNGVINSSDPVRRRGGVVYVTDRPCDDCYRFLAGSGLARVVWPEFGADGTVTIRSALLGPEHPIGGLYG